MTKKLFATALVLSLGTTAAAGAKSYWERTASQELGNCLSLAKEPGYEIVTEEVYGSACFAGGAQVDVEFYKVPRCNGPSCDTVRLAAELVAVGHFICDDFAYGECFVQPEPILCLAVYEPVCGVDGMTYSNACNAEANGVYDYVDGECGGGLATQ